MYSIFLPFAAMVVDLCVAYIYLKHNWWLGGGTTALIALIPLFITAFLLYSGTSRLKQATVFLGFLHSGTQLLFQITLLFKHWGEFGEVIIQYGTLGSPQYSIVMLSCIFSSLVVAKSARECHFLCQAPEKNHVSFTASHFRATPFFLLHTSFRSLSLGLIGAFLPFYPWSWYTVMFLFLGVNFLVNLKVFFFPPLISVLTAFTAVLTPSIYPTDTPVHITVVANFHIVNSVTTTAIIALCALVQSLSVDLRYEWNKWSLSSTNSTHLATATCLPSSPDCSTPSASFPPLPPLLALGILPPLLLLGVFYILMVVLVMGLIRPGFLQLPVRPSPPVAEEEEEEKVEVDITDKRVRSISLDESRYKVNFGRGLSFSSTLPTIEDEEAANNNTSEHLDMNMARAASSDTVGLTEEEVESVVRLVEGELEEQRMERCNYRFSQIHQAPETDM